MNIPEEAIEAAAKAMYGRQVFEGDLDQAWEALPKMSLAYWRAHGKTALEAAAPIIAAQALRDAADSIQAHSGTLSIGVVVDALRLKANRIEGTHS